MRRGDRGTGPETLFVAFHPSFKSSSTRRVAQRTRELLQWSHGSMYSDKTANFNQVDQIRSDFPITDSRSTKSIRALMKTAETRIMRTNVHICEGGNTIEIRYGQIWHSYYTLGKYKVNQKFHGIVEKLHHASKCPHLRMKSLISIWSGKIRLSHYTLWTSVHQINSSSGMECKVSRRYEFCQSRRGCNKRIRKWALPEHSSLAF